MRSIDPCNCPVCPAPYLDDAVTRIIVVEDHESVRRSLERVLTTAGFAITSFESAEELLEPSNTSLQADCLLIDVQLPGMSGLQLCRALRQQRVRIPIISMSCDHSDSLQAAALRSGAAAHLSKPFARDSLLRALDRVLPASQRA